MYGPWLGAPREPRFFNERRILVKQIIDWTEKRIWAAITDEELYNSQNAFNLLPKRGTDLDFILGVLNSKLMTYYHRKRFLDEYKMRFQKILIKDCKRFPIRILDTARRRDLAKKIGQLAKKLTQYTRSITVAKTDDEKGRQARKFEAIDAEVDRLVYELYGLTKKEIELIEMAI